MDGLGLEPTSPSSRKEIALTLNHSATTTCSEMELNNRIYINSTLATTPKTFCELVIVSDAPTFSTAETTRTDHFSLLLRKLPNQNRPEPTLGPDRLSL